MPLYLPENTPEQNLQVLAENEYPGRLLVIGFAGQHAVLAAALTGRSPDTQNRVYVDYDNIVSTEVADESRPLKDPDLTIYDTMRDIPELHIVSNGDQTDRLIRYVRSGRTVLEALEATDYEPDSNNTARITAFITIDPLEDEPNFGISVITKDPDSDRSVRKLYTDESPELQLPEDRSEPFAFAVHTYLGEGSPLPTFTEVPFRIPVADNPYAMAKMLYDALPADKRIAVAAKYISNAFGTQIASINEAWLK